MDHSALSASCCPEFEVVSWAHLEKSELIIIRNRLKGDVKLEFDLTEKQQGEIYRIAYKILGQDAGWIRDLFFRQTHTRKSVQDLFLNEASKVISGMRALAKS